MAFKAGFGNPVPLPGMTARDRVARIASKRRSDGVNVSADFDLTVYETGGRQDTIRVNASYTMRAVKKLIRDEILHDASAQVSLMNMNLDNKTLKYYGFPKIGRRNFVTIAFQASGGAAAWGAADDEKERSINFEKFPHLKPSSEPDCIMMTKQDGELCAEMPCGCAISAPTMFMWISCIFSKSLDSYVLTCPTEKHKHIEWDWDLCTEVANLSDQEYLKWSTEKDRRKLGKFRECPHCKASVARKGEVYIARVNCDKCRGPDWCWQCAQRWRSTGLMICGNSNCTLVQDLNRQLAEAEEITLKYINAKCPSVRACPRCLTLTEWTSACKHMHCKGCNKKFCFSCLGLEDSNGKWPCNDYDYKCPIAPRQKFDK